MKKKISFFMMLAVCTIGVQLSSTSMVYGANKNTLTAPDSPMAFTDLAEDAWYTPFIKKAVTAGFITVTEETFAPNKTMTRGEFIDMLVRGLDIDSNYEDEVPYADISIDTPHYDSIMKAKASKLLGKLAIVPQDANIILVPGMIRADRVITRAEMAILLATVIENKEESPAAIEKTVATVFTDLKDVEPDTLEAIERVYHFQIMMGVAEDVFAPQNEVTRAQGVTAIIKTIELLKPSAS